MPLVDYLIQPGEMNLSPDAIDRKRKLAQMLMAQGSDYSPVDSWTQGAARMANALVGNLKEWQLDKAEKANMDRGNAVLSGLAGALMGGDTSSPAASSTAGIPGAGGYNPAGKMPAFAQIDQHPTVKTAYNFYTQNGLSPAAASGMIGQYAQESGFNPTAYNAKENAYGLGQWRGDRLEGLKQFAAQRGTPISDVNTQLAYSLYELQNRENGTFAKLQQAQDPTSATLAAIGYERPRGWTPQNPAGGDAFQNRLAAANAVYSKFGQGGAAPAAPAAPVAAPAAQPTPADVPAAGAQPAGYQIPGQAPAAVPAAPAAMPAQANRAALMQKVIQAWPYLNDSQRQQAQMILQMAPKPMTPLEQIQMQEAGLKVQDMLHNQQNWATSDAKGQVDLDRAKADLARLGTTGDIDEYRFYQQDQQAHGLQPKSFNDWMLDKRKAGAITIDQRAEGAEQTGRGQGLAKRLNDVADEGAKAQEDAYLYQHFGSMLQDVQTGPGTNLAEKIRQFTGGAVNLDPKTDKVQAVNSLINYMAPRMRVAGSGSQSDRELGNFLQSMPTLYNTPGGNELINTTLQAAAEYRMKRAEIAQSWQTGDLTGKEATKLIQQLPNPYLGLTEKIAALRKQSGASIPETGPNGAPTNLTSPVGQPLNNGWVDVGGGFKIRQK